MLQQMTAKKGDSEKAETQATPQEAEAASKEEREKQPPDQRV